MKILSFAASNSSHSINKQLVQYATQLIKQQSAAAVDVELIDLNDFEMPLYGIDRESRDGIPDLAQQFLDKIKAADGLLISFAEHNGNYTVAYKNIFDWCSRINAKVYQDKPMVLLSTSPGKNGGGQVLKTATEAAPFFAGKVLASLAVPKFNQNFNQQQAEITDSDIQAALLKTLSAFNQLTN